MRYTDALWKVLKEIDDVDDFDFEFACSLLSFCLKNNGITDRQVNCARKLLKKYKHLFPETPEEKFQPLIIKDTK